MEDLKKYCESFALERVEIRLDDFIKFCFLVANGNEHRAKVLFALFLGMASNSFEVMDACSGIPDDLSNDGCELLASMARITINEALDPINTQTFYDEDVDAAA